MGEWRVSSFIASNKKTTAVFIGFEKAFELATTAAMLYSLISKEVKRHILAWKKNPLTGKLG